MTTERGILSGPQAPLSHLDVLIVEDNPDFAQLLIEALRGTTSWTVAHADRLTTAVDAMRAQRFDVVLLDLSLPDSRTSETFERARQSMPDVPIIVLTGTSDEETAVTALKHGAQDFLVKGEASLSLLSRAIRYAIERERILSQLERELRASEARLRRIIESNADGVAVVDDQGVIRFANPAAEGLLGRRAHELVGSAWGYPLAGGTEVELPAATGRPRVAELRAVPTDWEGAPATLVSLRDITDRRQLQLDLDHSRTQQLIAKDQFLSHVSHELRSPLAAMIQFVSMVLDEVVGPITAEQREYLDIVQRNGRQLRSMIDDLLEATRADEGKLAVSPQWISLADLGQEVLRTFQTAADAKQITLSAWFEPDLPSAYADPRRVRAIFHNLIGNSIKFTGAGGAVSVRASRQVEHPGFIHMAVTDTGCGISAEGLPRVFDRLFQEPNSNEESGRGLGLGLFITRELVLGHGGQIWAESELGKGSTFSFTLPASPAASGGVRRAQMPTVTSAPRATSNEPRS